MWDIDGPFHLCVENQHDTESFRNTRSSVCCVFFQALKKLNDTMANLNKKKEFFDSQIDYYKQYVSACLGNMLASHNKRYSYFLYLLYYLLQHSLS